MDSNIKCCRSHTCASFFYLQRRITTEATYNFWLQSKAQTFIPLAFSAMDSWSQLEQEGGHSKTLTFSNLKLQSTPIIQKNS